MWYSNPNVPPDWSVAQKHLSAADPVMAAIIARVGNCMLTPMGTFPGNALTVLCKSIFSQQISTKVAAVLFARFRELFPGKRPTPARTVKLLRGRDGKKPPMEVLRGKKVGFRAGGIEWYWENLTQNAMVFGQPGSGKTVCVLNAMLDGLLGATAAVPGFSGVDYPLAPRALFLQMNLTM